MAKHDLGDMVSLQCELEKWLAEHLPGGRGLTLDELKFPEESGESSVTLLLNAHFGGSTTKLVCRMKPRDSQVFDSHDLALQYRLMEICSENDVPVPQLLGYEPDESLLGSDFYIMGFTEGLIPTDNPPYAFGSWVTELDSRQRTDMWRNGIAILAKIHSIDMSRYELPDLPQAGSHEAPMQHEIRKFQDLVDSDMQARLTPVLTEAWEYLQTQVPTAGARRLVWGDSRPGNVIWSDLAPVAVIDWEMASLGDPLADVAWWFWIDHVNSVGLGVDMLSGLPQIDEVYSLWHEYSGLPIHDAEYYSLLCLVRYAIILEKKFIAFEAMGAGSMDNFSLPFVERQFNRCLGL